MLDTLHGVGRWLVHDMGWVSLEILVLTAIVWGITRWCGVRSSRARRWLWTLVILKPLTALLIGWPIVSPLGRAPGIQPIGAVETSRLANVPSLADAVPASRLPGDWADRTPDHEPPADLDVVTRAGTEAVTGFAVLGVLWVAGCVALAAHTVVGVWWLSRVKRQAVALGRDELLAGAGRHHSDIAELLSKLPVLLTTRITEPCIYGFLRPVILLPAWCLADDSPANLEYILLHEAMHRRARDHWFMWLRRAVEVFVWFHPAVWYAGRRAMAEAENVCDEAVVDFARRRGTPDPALGYSACLMRVLEHAKRRPFAGLAPGIVATAARIHRLVGRTETINTAPSLRSVVGVVALAVVMLPGALRGDSALAARAYRAAVSDSPPVREILYATRYPGDYFRSLYTIRSDGTGPKRITDDR